MEQRTATSIESSSYVFNPAVQFPVHNGTVVHAGLNEIYCQADVAQKT